LDFEGLAARAELSDPSGMKKPRKAKKRPAKKRKPQLDVNQLAAKLIRITIDDSEKAKQ
jgi:hypothetical protein